MKVTDEMVTRFLGWKLPQDFLPDCGISFTPYMVGEPLRPLWPIGTNLLHAGQARAMLEHVLGEATDARDATAAERERCARLCEQWNTTPGAKLAREIRGDAAAPVAHVKTAAEMRHDAAHDTSCVGAFARARPGA